MNMTCDAAKPTERKREADEQLDEAMGAVEGLHKLLESLEGRLRPVLRQEPESNSKDSAVVNLTPLADNIRRIGFGVTLGCSKLNSILNRLEV